MNIERQRWFDRSFELGTPVERLPDIIERLRGTHLRLAERVGGVSESGLVHRPNGAWSIQEHVGHLADLELLWLGRLGDLEAGLEELRPTDLENSGTWDADHNARPMEAVLGDFAERRSELIHRMEAVSTDTLTVGAIHTRLGQPMTAVDLCFFAAEHDDHHLAAISSIRRSR
ncbi:MAG: DinB family protein [Longimicrobiales bacterium]